MRHWQPLAAKTAATHSLLHPENERQQRVNNFWSCIIGNQGIVWIFEHIKELLTTFIGNNTIYQRKNTDSKIIYIATCQTCNNKLLAVVYTILISHYYQTAKSKFLYESIDGPAGRPTDNPPNAAEFANFHWTLPELTVWVDWQSWQHIWRQFSLDPDPDPKWPSGTVSNRTHNSQLFCRWVGLSSPAAASPSPAVGATATGGHHEHHRHWEYGIRRWRYSCTGCDVAWRLGMVSVIRSRNCCVCYFIPGFVDIS